MIMIIIILQIKKRVNRLFYDVNTWTVRINYPWTKTATNWNHVTKSVIRLREKSQLISGIFKLEPKEFIWERGYTKYTHTLEHLKKNETHYL